MSGMHDYTNVRSQGWSWLAIHNRLHADDELMRADELAALYPVT